MKPEDKTKVTSGKPHEIEVLPNRMSMTTITQVDTYNRAMNNYAKDAKAPDFGNILGVALPAKR